MNTALELLIVIINYKTPQLVIDCLETVLPQLTPGRRVVIVDNDSADGSLEKIQDWLDTFNDPRIELLPSDSNTGFSGGNNIGIRSAKAEHYLLLNSDTLLREGALNTLLKTAAQHPEAGIISPRLEWPDGTEQISCFRYHSPLSELINAAQTAPITQLFSRWNVPIPTQQSLSTPQWTSFACVLVKQDLISDIGLMDEGYFLYYEDVDFCRETVKAGWKIINNPSARVVHLRGGSSPVKRNKKINKRLPLYYYQSRTRFFAKQYGIFGLLAGNLCWHIGRSIALLRRITGKNIQTCDKQYRDIWANFHRPL